MKIIHGWMCFDSVLLNGAIIVSKHDGFVLVILRKIHVKMRQMLWIKKTWIILHDEVNSMFWCNRVEYFKKCREVYLFSRYRLRFFYSQRKRCCCSPNFFLATERTNLTADAMFIVFAASASFSTIFQKEDTAANRARHARSIRSRLMLRAPLEGSENK